jgi:RND family efflux transporter MFP subunit
MKETGPQLEALRIDRGRSDEAGRRRSGVLITLVVLALVLGGGGYWWMTQRGLMVQTALAVPVASDGGRIALNASGYVVARRAATVSSKITGKVVEVLIEEGMEVQEGQVLARLDDTNIRAGLRLSEAQLESAKAALAETQALLRQAEKELLRVEALTQTQIASESDLDAALAAVDALRARLELQQADVGVAERNVAVRCQDLEDTIIRAPFSGMATAKNAQPGEMISPVSAGGGFTRTGIGTLVDMDSLEIEVEVNESYLQRVSAGQRVEAVLDAYPEWKIPGSVIAIIPTADRQKATVKVRVGFDQLDTRMLPEMGVKVAFLASAGEVVGSKSVVVPRRALRKIEGRDAVYVVTEGWAEQRWVSLGVLRGEEVVVTEGLEPGEKVITDGPEGLTAGANVREAEL